MTTVVRCPRTGRACREVTCRERHWCRQMLDRGLSPSGLPLKRRYRPRCCAKTRAGAPCIMRVVPGKRRCRFHGGLSTGPRTVEGKARIAEAQRRRWRAFRAVTSRHKPRADAEKAAGAGAVCAAVALQEQLRFGIPGHGTPLTLAPVLLKADDVW